MLWHTQPGKQKKKAQMHQKQRLWEGQLLGLFATGWPVAWLPPDGCWAARKLLDNYGAARKLLVMSTRAAVASRVLQSDSMRTAACDAPTPTLLQ
jgi:hypothetical protein